MGAATTAQHRPATQRAVATPPPLPPTAPPRGAADDTAHDEQIFEYHVVSDVWRRSIDSVRIMDTFLSTVFAAQVAIFVLFIDKTERFQSLVTPTRLGVVFCAIAFLPTLALVELPSPVKFKAAFRKAPRRTRDDLIDQFIRAARRNAVLRSIKMFFLVLAFGATMWAVFNAGRIELTAMSAATHPHSEGHYWIL
jgi:hypothetical protein